MTFIYTCMYYMPRIICSRILIIVVCRSDNVPKLTFIQGKYFKYTSTLLSWCDHIVRLLGLKGTTCRHDLIVVINSIWENLPLWLSYMHYHYMNRPLVGCANWLSYKRKVKHVWLPGAPGKPLSPGFPLMPGGPLTPGWPCDPVSPRAPVAPVWPDAPTYIE